MLESRSQMKHVACSTAQHILEKEKEYIIQTSLVGGGGGTCTHTGHPPPLQEAASKKNSRCTYSCIIHSCLKRAYIPSVRLH